MKFLYDASQPEVEAWVCQKGYPGFRAKQIFQWLAKGVVSFDQMTDLSREIRASLAGDYYVNGVVIAQKKSFHPR